MMSDKDRYELKIAGLLHDCGKITTPVHVVDKATKLETIYRPHPPRRHAFRGPEARGRDRCCSRLKLPRWKAHGTAPRNDAAEQDVPRARIASYDDDREFLRACNIGGERMGAEDQASVSTDRPAYSLDRH